MALKDTAEGEDHEAGKNSGKDKASIAKYENAGKAKKGKEDSSAYQVGGDGLFAGKGQPPKAVEPKEGVEQRICNPGHDDKCPRKNEDGQDDWPERRILLRNSAEDFSPEIESKDKHPLSFGRKLGHPQEVAEHQPVNGIFGLEGLNDSLACPFVGRIQPEGFAEMFESLGVVRPFQIGPALIGMGERVFGIFGKGRTDGEACFFFAAELHHGNGAKVCAIHMLGIALEALFGGIESFLPFAIVQVNAGEDGIVVRVVGFQTNCFVDGILGLAEIIAVEPGLGERAISETHIGGEADSSLGFLGGILELLGLSKAQGEERMGHGVVRVLGQDLPELRNSEVVAGLLV